MANTLFRFMYASDRIHFNKVLILLMTILIIVILVHPS